MIGKKPESYDEYSITSVSIEDIENAGYDASELTHENMVYFAEIMAECFVEYNMGFLDCIEQAAKRFNLKDKD